MIQSVCENSIDGAVKVVAQGLEGGVVAECMADIYRRLPRGALRLEKLLTLRLGNISNKLSIVFEMGVDVIVVSCFQH